MIRRRKINRSSITILIIFLSVAMLTKCISQNDNKKKKWSYSDYAGSQTCASCHKDISEKHMNTGHYRTSQPASGELIIGSFEKEHNSFAFSEWEKIRMEKKEYGYYQTEYSMGKERRKGKFDIVVGSGKKGQSYLSWKYNSLIQLPVTYFTPESTWSSSPGFNPQKIVFNRVVTSRCLECHSTYFQTISAKDKHPEEFDKNNILYGVDCERCHGPGKEHVSFHTANPNQKQGKYIVNTGKLSRQKNLDMCALCHSGRLNKLQPSFSFQPGDNLKDFFESASAPPDQPFGMDVHGNQLGMLSQSKCFISSDMTCGSCHNAHEKEQNKIQIFSDRCSNCHTGTNNKVCKLLKTEGSIINTNCIDCHMPFQPSQSIAVYLEGATIPTPARLRTHHIKVYNEETQKVLDFLRKSANK